MRLRKLELAVIALTLAFICFMGGYFTGRRGSVNVITVSAKPTETQSFQEASAVFEPLGPAAQEPGGKDRQADSNGTDQSAAEASAPEEVGALRGGDGRININIASQSELMDLPGIGSVLASRIVDYRRQNGGFSKIEDLRNVSGIGEKRFEAIQDKVTVG